MFHNKEQRKKIRELRVGSGVLIYKSASDEVCEVEFYIDRKTGRPCYVRTGREVEFRLTLKEEEE